MTYGNGQGQPEDREPVERVVDLFVHTPIGLAVMAWKRFPELVGSVPDLVGQAVSRGCSQLSEAEARLTEEVRKARMIGQVAVTFGGRQLRREVDARLRDARQAAGGAAAFLPGSGPDGERGGDGVHGASPVTTTTTPTRPASPPGPAGPRADRPQSTRATAGATGPRRTTAKATPPKAAPARKAAAKTKPAKPTPAKPSKSAKPSKPAGSSRSAGSSKGVGPSERVGPSKSAVPAKASAKAASRPAPGSADDLPIREYDGLSASQVVSRLTGLTPGELRAVRSYEEAGRGRRTVLVAIDRLLA